MIKIKNVVYGITTAALLLSCSDSNTQKSSVKIVGGSEPTGDNPGLYSAVALAFGDDNFCSAVLTNDNMVVTAAHCIEWIHPSKYKDISIIFYSKSQNSPLEFRRNVTSGKIHPNYKNYTVNDSAWLKFEGGIPEGYKPIEILTDTDRLTPGYPLTLVGFGATSEFGGESGTKLSVDTKISKYIAEGPNAGILAFGGTPGKSACFGDSGGPAYMKVEDKWYVVATTSGPDILIANTFSCDAGNGLYTHIGYHSDWIQSSSGVKLPLVSLNNIDPVDPIKDPVDPIKDPVDPNLDHPLPPLPPLPPLR